MFRTPLRDCTSLIETARNDVLSGGGGKTCYICSSLFLSLLTLESYLGAEVCDCLISKPASSGLCCQHRNSLACSEIGPKVGQCMTCCSTSSLLFLSLPFQISPVEKGICSGSIAKQNKKKNIPKGIWR